MSLRSPLAYCLPDETARVARAAFPRGNAYLRVSDALGPIFANPQFADLYPKDGQPAEDPARPTRCVPGSTGRTLASTPRWWSSSGPAY
jgi:hypothetical protein